MSLTHCLICLTGCSHETFSVNDEVGHWFTFSCKLICPSCSFSALIRLFLVILAALCAWNAFLPDAPGLFFLRLQVFTQISLLQWSLPWLPWYSLSCPYALCFSVALIPFHNANIMYSFTFKLSLLLRWNVYSMKWGGSFKYILFSVLSLASRKMLVNSKHLKNV